jgi:hypothetical protein
VTSWARFAREAPELAAAGRRLLEAHGIAFLATRSKDGAPRIAPVCPIFAGEDLALSVAAGSPKHFDLANDGRYALHAVLGASDEEFQIGGRARLVEDAAGRAAVHAAIAFQYKAEHPVFLLDVERCLWGYWEKAGQPGTRPVRRSWSEGRGERA